MFNFHTKLLLPLKHFNSNNKFKVHDELHTQRETKLISKNLALFLSIKVQHLNIFFKKIMHPTLNSLYILLFTAMASAITVKS